MKVCFGNLDSLNLNSSYPNKVVLENVDIYLKYFFHHWENYILLLILNKPDVYIYI